MSRHTTQAGPGSQFFVRREVVLAPVAAEDLVAWYPFRQGDGSDATAGISAFGDSTDYSATVNGATYKPSGGTTDIQTGANSGAFDFDGTDDDLEVQSKPGLNFGTNSFSISAAVEVDNLNADHSVFEKNGTSALYQLTIDTNGKATSAINEGPATKVVRVPGVSSSPVRITVVRDAQAGEIRCFNGGQSGVSSEPGLNVSNSAPLFFGFDSTSGGRMDGVLDDIRVYDTALSQSQHDQIRNNTIP